MIQMLGYLYVLPPDEGLATPEQKQYIVAKMTKDCNIKN